MPRRTRSSLLALAAAAALLVGCDGASETSAYVDEVNQIQDEALSAVTTAAAASPRNNKQLSEQLEVANQALEGALADFREVDVPEEAREGHERFVAGIEQLSELFGETADDVEKASGEELAAEVAELQAEGTRISGEIDAAISQINRDIGAE